MNYEQRYEEALARAKEQLDGAKVFDYDNEQIVHDIRTTVYNIFPELKEPEDEQIRKELIDYLKERKSGESYGQYVLRYDRWINWLEKQGEQKSTLPKWKYKNDNTPLLRDSLILNKYGCVVKSPSGAIVSDVWIIDYDELAKLPKEEFDENKI